MTVCVLILDIQHIAVPRSQPIIVLHTPVHCSPTQLVIERAMPVASPPFPSLTLGSIITQVYWCRSRISVCFRSAATSGRSCRSNCGWASVSVGDIGGRSHCDGLTVSGSDGFRSSMHVVVVLACFFITGVLVSGRLVKVLLGRVLLHPLRRLPAIILLLA